MARVDGPLLVVVIGHLKDEASRRGTVPSQPTCLGIGQLPPQSSPNGGAAPVMKNIAPVDSA
jgi:hypothetical protein